MYRGDGRWGLQPPSLGRFDTLHWDYNRDIWNQDDKMATSHSKCLTSTIVGKIRHCEQSAIDPLYQDKTVGDNYLSIIRLSWNIRKSQNFSQKNEKLWLLKFGTWRHVSGLEVEPRCNAPRTKLSFFFFFFSLFISLFFFFTKLSWVFPSHRKCNTVLQSRALCNNSKDAVCFKYFMKYQVAFSRNLGFVLSRG